MIWFAVWSLLACSPGAPGSPGPAGPNVLLITVDTLRADHLGAYGYERATSPTLDALAAGGVRYSRAYSPRGATWPALTTMMTSWYPSEHGVRENATVSTDEPTTLAEVLHTYGYRSAAILTNADNAHWEGFDSIRPVQAEPRDANAASEVEKWLETPRPDRWFLWVHLSSPHDPYVDHPEVRSFLDPSYPGPVSDAQAPLVRAMFDPSLVAPGALGRSADLEAIVARYDSEVANADVAIGRILTALRLHRLDASTLVVVSADHGEELAEHPPYLFHFMSPWDAVLRVPLIVSQPGRLPGGKVVDDAVGLIDVAPAVLDWLALPAPPVWHGSSLASLPTAAPAGGRPVYSELSVEALIVHSGRWAMIANPGGYVGELAPPMQLLEAGIAPALAAQNRWPLPRRALFDVVVDPRQQNDVQGANPEVVKQLEAGLVAFRKATGWPGASTAPASPEVRQQLERLGYTSGDL